MSGSRFGGVLVPVVTPFDAGLAPDLVRLVQACRRLLAEGAGGLAVFGTTSEANSMSGRERMALLDGLLEAGVPAARLMPGTGACSVTEAARLTRHAVDRGCGGVLMLPPFYYKGVSDDGLFAFVARVVDAVGSAGLRIYLYHIPPVAQVGFSLDLIGRLVTAFPGTVVGLKDSSGDWANSRAVLEAFPGFSVFVGSETLLLNNMRHGGAGCISATANVNLPAIGALFHRWQDTEAESLQAQVSSCRAVFQSYPLVPALKAVIAHRQADPAWARVRPPMTPLDAAATADLVSRLTDAGFAALTRPRSDQAA